LFNLIDINETTFGLNKIELEKPYNGSNGIEISNGIEGKSFKNKLKFFENNYEIKFINKTSK
jgi:hypothetical protein